MSHYFEQTSAEESAFQSSDAIKNSTMNEHVFIFRVCLFECVCVAGVCAWAESFLGHTKSIYFQTVGFFQSDK